MMRSAWDMEWAARMAQGRRDTDLADSRALHEAMARFTVTIRAMTVAGSEAMRAMQLARERIQAAGASVPSDVCRTLHVSLPDVHPR